MGPARDLRDARLRRIRDHARDGGRGGGAAPGGGRADGGGGDDADAAAAAASGPTGDKRVDALVWSLRAQLQVVNSAVVNYLLVDAKLNDHFKVSGGSTTEI